MKRLILALLVVALAGFAWWRYDSDGDAAANAKAAYRTVTAQRGAIVAQVSTTGTVTPITTVIVGSQLSGQIVEIQADYNSEVKTGQLLARLNSDQIRARLDAARAELAQSAAARSVLDAQMEKSKADAARADAVIADMRAQFDRAQTQLADAEKTLARQSDLSGQGIVSATVLQSARTQRDTLNAQRQSAQAQIESSRAQKLSLLADQKIIEAQMKSSEAQILQRTAVVRQIEVDLANTDIRSPVDGVVIQRNVELGQPVAASLQAPTLFLVAQDLRKIQIQANVDEADVGRVQAGQAVSFSVNAYPGRTFEGKVRMVRLGSQTVQNVVIYTTIIDVENPVLELKPGMTASLRILTEQRENVLRVPNAALRWRPPASEAASASGISVSAVVPGGGEQSESGTPGGPFTVTGRSGGRGLFVERLKAELGLNDEQKAALDKALAEMPDTRRAGGPGGGRAAREAFSEKVMSVLNDEQKARYTALQEARRGQGGGRGGGGGRTESSAAQRRAPAEAVVMGRVYRLGPSGEPVGVPVRLGVSDGAFTEALSGLSDGAVLITGGGAGAGPTRAGGFRFGF